MMKMMMMMMMTCRFHHQSLVEVKVLDALRRFDIDNKFNIIHMTDYFLFRSHLCIVFELMGYEELSL